MLGKLSRASMLISERLENSLSRLAPRLGIQQFCYPANVHEKRVSLSSLFS